MTSKEFCVVVFDETQEVDVSPSVWLAKDKRTCRWPPYKDTENSNGYQGASHTWGKLGYQSSANTLLLW